MSPVLLALAFICSTITAVVGVGGGALLLLCMIHFVPPVALIPLHGVTQITSGFSRALFQWKAVQRPIVLWCALGGIIGTGIASLSAIHLPEKVLLLVLASSILILTWIKPPMGLFEQCPRRFFWVGSFLGFLSSITGAVGPALAPFLLHKQLNRDQVITTQAACVGCIDTFKVLWFVAFGFVLTKYLPLAISMSFAVILGSFVGTFLRGSISEYSFRPLMRGLVTISALQVLVGVIWG